MYAQSPSIAICLPCIAANRLVLSLREPCYMKILENPTVVPMNNKPVYDLRALSQLRGRNSTFEVVSSYHSEADIEMEEESYNGYKQRSSA